MDAIAVFETIYDVQTVINALPLTVRSAARVLIDAYRTRFPWFGRLWTFYFEGDPPFAVDIGVITEDELSTFYVEPDAIAVLDPSGAVAERKARCYRDRLEARRVREASVEFDMFHTLTKLEHALRRGHLWNAFEYVNILRRLLFELTRAISDPPEYIHVGRPERDIETAVPSVTHYSWNETIPAYCPGAIIDSALLIVDRINALPLDAAVGSRSALLTAAISRLSLLRQASKE